MAAEALTLSLDVSPMTEFLSSVRSRLDALSDVEKQKLASDLEAVLSASELAQIEPGGVAGEYRAVPSREAVDCLHNHAAY